MEVEAKNLGTYGAVFEIEEQNLLDQILEKLNEAKESGNLEKMQASLQKKLQNRFLGSFEKGRAMRAEKYRSWTYDPSFIVSSDLKDHLGRVFAKKGTKINPLDQVSFGEDMLFINGEDPEQIGWSLKQKGKIILVRGQPIKLEEQLEKTHSRPIYFDQQAVLRKKFDLRYFPARISQKNESDRVLFVEEIENLEIKNSTKKDDLS